MTRASALVYIRDPFGVYGSVFVLVSPDQGARCLSSTEVSECDRQLITLESRALIEELRRYGAAPPSRVIDVGDALRLCVGLPRDEGREQKADVWRLLNTNFNDPERGYLFRKVFQSEILRPSDNLETLLGEAGDALLRLWAQIESLLRSTGEYSRFEAVEAPVARIFGARQYSGIAVNQEQAIKLLESVLAEKYRAYRTVAETLGRSVTNLTFWNVGPLLHATDARFLADIDNGGKLREAFKLAASSGFARAFLEYTSATQDESVIRHAMGAGERMYPTFDPLGTVTGRILVSDPYLQQLRRRHRSILKADKGRSFIYLDYTQFEPGILAYLAGDESLIKAYNEGDLYLRLSEVVFGNRESRSLAKRMFLAFCYGMSADRLADFVAGEGSDDRYRQKNAITHFFDAFSGLKKFRSRMEAELSERGAVSSLMGNRRTRTQTGALTSKEKRWAVNQPVQATASLIFKEALIALARRFGHDAIVLPMHDAVLMQVPADDLEPSTAEAREMMIAAFEERCPGVKARVSVGGFWE